MQVLRSHLPEGLNAVAALPGFGWQAAWPPLPRPRATAGALVLDPLSTLPAAVGAGVQSSGSSAARPSADQHTSSPLAPLSAARPAGGGQSGETVPTGAFLVPQTGVLQGPQSGMASTFAAGEPPMRCTSGVIGGLKSPSGAAQRAESSTAPSQIARGVQREQQRLQSQQQRQLQPQRDAPMDQQAVHDAHAAWTAATWRLISGLQPQP